jgi:hypothetical protein
MTAGDSDRRGRGMKPMTPFRLTKRKQNEPGYFLESAWSVRSETGHSRRTDFPFTPWLTR